MTLWPIPSVQRFLSLVNCLLLLSWKVKIFTLKHFSFSFKVMVVVFIACHTCFHVRSLTLLLRHLECSCANIHADYYFISMIVTD